MALAAAASPRNSSIIPPALMAAMQLTMQLIQGNAIGPESMRLLNLLIAFDVAFTAVSLYLVETVLVG